MDKRIRYAEESVVLKHPFQPAVAESVVSLANHFAIFFTEEALMFNTATLELTKRIKLAAPLFRPVQVGPDQVCGLMISRRRLTFLDLQTGQLRLLMEVPTEIYTERNEPYQWWNFHSFLRFPISQCFGFRQESTNTVYLKFFSLERELSSLKFKKEGLKLNNDTQIDQFDNERTMVMFGLYTKRGRIALELYDVQDSRVVQLTIKNDNIDEGKRTRLIRKLPLNEMLIALDQQGEAPCQTMFMRLELQAMEVISVFHRSHCRLLRTIYLNEDRSELLLEELNSRSRCFQLTWLNYETTEAEEAVNTHAKLVTDIANKYLFCLSKQPKLPQGQTHILVCKWYRKCSLYSHLLHNASSIDSYGPHLLHEVFHALEN